MSIVSTRDQLVGVHIARRCSLQNLSALQFYTINTQSFFTQKSDDLWLRWAALLHDILAMTKGERIAPVDLFAKATKGLTLMGHQELAAMAVSGSSGKLRVYPPYREEKTLMVCSTIQGSGIKDRNWSSGFFWSTSCSDATMLSQSKQADSKTD